MTLVLWYYSRFWCSKFLCQVKLYSKECLNISFLWPSYSSPRFPKRHDKDRGGRLGKGGKQVSSHIIHALRYLGPAAHIHKMHVFYHTGYTVHVLLAEFREATPAGAQAFTDSSEQTQKCLWKILVNIYTSVSKCPVPNSCISTTVDMGPFKAHQLSSRWKREGLFPACLELASSTRASLQWKADTNQSRGLMYTSIQMTKGMGFKHEDKRAPAWPYKLTHIHLL